MDQEPQRFPREIRKHMGNEAGSWQDSTSSVTRAEGSYYWFQETLKRYGLDLTKGLKVLEVGSGNATLLDFLRKQKVNVVGVDVSLRGKKESPLAVARLEQLPFKDESFDVVLSSFHVFDTSVYDQDQDLMMKEITRVLKHKGMYLGFIESRIHASPIEGFEFIPDPDDLVEIYKKS